MDSHQTTNVVELDVRMVHTLCEVLPAEVVSTPPRNCMWSPLAASPAVGAPDWGKLGQCGVGVIVLDTQAEFYDRRAWKTFDVAKRSPDGSKVIYHRQRLHTSVGMVPPLVFELGLRRAIKARKYLHR